MTAVNLNRAVRGPITAVPIVAGKGIRLVADTQNNRWLVEADETTLWEGNAFDNIVLSERIDNFERIGIFFSVSAAYSQGTDNYGGKWTFFEAGDLIVTKKFCVSDNINDGNNRNTLIFRNRSYTVGNDNRTLTLAGTTQLYYNGSSWSTSTRGGNIYKVIGIHRVANN